MPDVIPFAPAERQRVEAMDEIMALLRLSHDRPLTKDELTRLRQAEAKANRRSRA